MILIDIVENNYIIKRYYVQSAIVDKKLKRVSFFDGRQWRSIRSNNIRSISLEKDKISVKI